MTKRKGSSLEEEIKKREGYISALEKSGAPASKERRFLNTLKNKSKPKPKHVKLEVSDHALVRYLERGIKIKTELARESISEAANKLYTKYGDGKYKLNDDLDVVIKDATVITLISRD